MMNAKDANEERVLAAPKKLATAYLKYGKELDAELESLAKAAMKAWPTLEKYR